MINNNSSFFNTLQDFQDKCNTYSDLALEIQQKNLVDLSSLDAIRCQTSTISSSLSTMKWTVEVLDLEKYSHILEAALITLNQLDNSLYRIDQNLKSYKSNQIKKIDLHANQKTLSEAQIKVINIIKIATEKLSKFHQTQSLDDERDATQNASYGTYSGIWSYITPLHNYYMAPVQQNLIFAPGKYYNPIPCSVTSYIQLSSDRIDFKNEIIGQMTGKEIDIMPTPFKNSTQAISDKYGEIVLVPSIFAIDLVRSAQLNLNQKIVYQKGQIDVLNPNEVARSLYELFGKNGAERVMLFCNQATFVHLFKDLAIPLSQEGAWSKQFPNDTLFPGSTDGNGMIINIDLDSQTKCVTLSIKELLVLTSVGEKIEIKAYFVGKVEIQLPCELLVNGDNDEFLKSALDINSSFRFKNSVSTLVINNLAEAQELHRKF